MSLSLKVKYPLLFITAGVLMTVSCKNGLLGKKKAEKSNVTGWDYNDKNQGGYYVPKAKDIKTAPGLVFIQGGTFTMGATQEDVMGDWNNVPRRVTVNSFFIDKKEVANVDYREYIHWIENTFTGAQYQSIVAAARPDSLVWRSELAYNEPYVEYYFRHPSYNNYPVVGVSWKQAHDFCIWRTDRVNEKSLIESGYQNKTVIKDNMGKGKNSFNTKSYLMGVYKGAPSTPTKRNAKEQLLDAQGNPRQTVQFEDGILFPDYRLPTEAEWEYAALGLVENNPRVSKSKKRRGEELITEKQVYPWGNDGYDGLRSTRRGANMGAYLANFKRGNGDYMGTAGGLNDNAATPGPTDAFLPNGFGIYNMAGNVSEWVDDVYRPNTSMDANDLNPYRGNIFQQVKKDASGKPVVDSLGRIEYVTEQDSLLRNRRNYQHAYDKDYRDGDKESGVQYGYGITTLINDHSRVYKGGSWNDMPYWLSPGTRRFLDEDQSSATIGFRCAMTYYGSSKSLGGDTGEGFNFKPSKRRRR